MQHHNVMRTAIVVGLTTSMCLVAPITSFAAQNLESTIEIDTEKTGELLIEGLYKNGVLNKTWNDLIKENIIFTFSGIKIHFITFRHIFSYVLMHFFQVLIPVLEKFLFLRLSPFAFFP